MADFCWCGLKTARQPSWRVRTGGRFASGSLLSASFLGVRDILLWQEVSGDLWLRTFGLRADFAALAAKQTATSEISWSRLCVCRTQSNNEIQRTNRSNQASSTHTFFLHGRGSVLVLHLVNLVVCLVRSSRSNPISLQRNNVEALVDKLSSIDGMFDQSIDRQQRMMINF
jgi:hypothetical protein